MSLKTYSLQARRQLMNVMDAVLACYGSHKGHTPSEKKRENVGILSRDFNWWILSDKIIVGLHGQDLTGTRHQI